MPVTITGVYIYIHSSNCSKQLSTCIGVASYGALGHVPPSTSNCLIFQVTSEPHKLWHSTPSGCLSSKNYSLSFVPPRTKSWRRNCLHETFHICVLEVTTRVYVMVACSDKAYCTDTLQCLPFSRGKCCPSVRAGPCDDDDDGYVTDALTGRRRDATPIQDREWRMMSIFTRADWRLPNVSDLYAIRACREVI